jgi:hypothetical protein
MKALAILSLLLAPVALAQSQGVECRQGADCRIHSLVVDGTTTLTGAVSGGGAVTATSVTSSGAISGTTITGSGALQGASLKLTNPAIGMLVGTDTVPFAVPVLPASGMRCGWAGPATVAATTFSAWGLTAPVVAGTPSAQAALTGATRQYVQWVSAATTANLGGITAGGSCDSISKPVAGSLFRWPGGESLFTFWTGIAEGSLTTAAPTSAAAATDLAMIGYRETTSTKFRCCTGDGTNMSCTDLAGNGAETPIAEHEYRAVVDPRTESGVATTCHLWDLTAGTYASLRKTSNVYRAAQGVGAIASIYVSTQENVAKTTQASAIWMCFN